MIAWLTGNIAGFVVFETILEASADIVKREESTTESEIPQGMTALRNASKIRLLTNVLQMKMTEEVILRIQMMQEVAALLVVTFT